MENKMKAILVDGIHDYNYSVEKTEVGKIHLLFRSSGEQWTNKNEEILSITDTGDGFIFNHSKPNKRMDYGYAFELSILLKIISFNDSVVEISQGFKLLLNYGSKCNI